MKGKRYILFSSGTEFELWYEHNCNNCVKAVFYNPTKDYYPKYRCAIQEHIEMAFIGDGKGNKRDYNATQSYDCPHKQIERKKYLKKQIEENDLFGNIYNYKLKDYE